VVGVAARFTVKPVAVVVVVIMVKRASTAASDSWAEVHRI
jgi:hypothetical protein